MKTYYRHIALLKWQIENLSSLNTTFACWTQNCMRGLDLLGYIYVHIHIEYCRFMHQDINVIWIKQKSFCSFYVSIIFFFKKLILEREEGGGRKRERKKHRYETETSISCLPHTHPLGIEQQPRHVP